MFLTQLAEGRRALRGSISAGGSSAMVRCPENSSLDLAPKMARDEKAVQANPIARAEIENDSYKLPTCTQGACPANLWWCTPPIRRSASPGSPGTLSPIHKCSIRWKSCSLTRGPLGSPEALKMAKHLPYYGTAKMAILFLMVLVCQWPGGWRTGYPQKEWPFPANLNQVV